MFTDRPWVIPSDEENRRAFDSVNRVSPRHVTSLLGATAPRPHQLKQGSHQSHREVEGAANNLLRNRSESKGALASPDASRVDENEADGKSAQHSAHGENNPHGHPVEQTSTHLDLSEERDCQCDRAQKTERTKDRQGKFVPVPHNAKIGPHRAEWT